MLLAQFISDATNRLQQANIESARLDVLVLLEDVLGKNRANLLAHPELELPRPALTKLNKFITQREQHTPLAYIRGEAPFYGRMFAVNTHVLVPRPETETMIALLMGCPLPARAHVVDIGTGSGCIGITAALELPVSNPRVALLDIDATALQIARKNARRHDARVDIQRQDLLQDYTEPIDAVLANLPYVPTDYPISTSATFEPDLALFGGKDGLDVYRTLWLQIKSMGSRPTYVLTEALEHQHEGLAALAAQAGYEQAEAQDLIQVFRAL